jgi:outer membrane immunogenic protein
MNKLAAVLAVSTVLAFGTTAKAADLVEAPAVYDWTGFYVGGNIGYAFEGQGDRVGVGSNKGLPKTHFGDLDITGITGGAQIGGDWQAGAAVFGIVADVQAADINDDFTRRLTLKNGTHLTTDAESQVDWWGTVRGRLGWAFNNVLIYGTGGLAWGSINYDVFTKNTDNGVNAHMSDDYTEWGWTAGGGIDWGITENWTVGGQVLYVNLGEKQITGRTNRFADTNEVLRTDATPDFWVARFLVNFRF